MSSNAMVAIRRILGGEGVAHCFSHVFSGDIGLSKEAHLRRILEEPSYNNAQHCSPSYVEGSDRTAAEVVLITDTVGDVREASNCGVRVIGVAWGMHSSDALLAAGAESVALWPQEILATLLPGEGYGSTGSDSDQSCCSTGDSCCRSCSADDPTSAISAAQQSSAATVVGPQTPSVIWPMVTAAGRLRRERQQRTVSVTTRGTRTPPPAARLVASTAPQPHYGRSDAALGLAVRRIAHDASTAL